MGPTEEHKTRRAAQKARQAKQQEPPKKNVWWFQEPLPIDRFTGWLMAFTCLLFLATVVNVGILFVTDHTLTQTMINGQRAYVSLSTTYGIKGAPGSVSLLIENSGVTPAKDVKVFVNWEFVPLGNNLPSGFTFPEKSLCDATIKSVGPVFPKNPMLTTNRLCGTDLENIALVEQGSLSAFLYGHISYRDIFNKIRKTTFCFLYKGSKGNPAGSILCDRNNEIDPDENTN